MAFSVVGGHTGHHSRNSMIFWVYEINLWDSESSNRIQTCLYLISGYHLHYHRFKFRTYSCPITSLWKREFVYVSVLNHSGQIFFKS